MYMKIDFKNQTNLYAYLFVFSSLGWYVTYHTKQVIKDIHPFSFILFTNTICLLTLFLLILLDHYYSFKILNRDLVKLTRTKITILFLLAYLYLLRHILFTTFLQYHDVHTMKISKYMMTIFVGALALYIFNNNSITFSKGLGFALISVGGLLFFDMNKSLDYL